MSRNAYYIPERNLLIFWSPKSGCTAVAQWLARAVFNIPASILKKHDPRKFLEENGYHLTYEKAYLISNQLDVLSIAACRDPWDRIVSAYFNKFVIYGKNYLTEFASLEPFAKSFYLSMHGLKSLPTDMMYEGISFSDFLKHIEHMYDRAVEHNKEPALDHHFSTQCPLFPPTSPVFDRVMRMEESQEQFKMLSGIFNSNFVPGQSNKTYYQQSSQISTAFDLPSINFSKLPDNLNKSAVDSHEARRIVEKVFAVDYRNFGYHPPK